MIDAARPSQYTPSFPRENAGGLIILSVFILSRLVFYLQGGAFIATPLAFAMQYLDPTLLKNDLSRSLFYLHSQPPLFNLMLGLVLKLSPVPSLSYAILFKTAGALIPLACYGTLSAIGVKRLAAVLITIVFMLNPTLILYENLLYYSYIETFYIALALFFLIRWGLEIKNSPASPVLGISSLPGADPLRVPSCLLSPHRSCHHLVSVAQGRGKTSCQNIYSLLYYCRYTPDAAVLKKCLGVRFFRDLIMGRDEPLDKSKHFCPGAA